MNNEDIEPQRYQAEEKSIIFVPITHFGEEAFYNSLRDSIIEWKSNDYTIFYEEISSNSLDSTKKAPYLMKWRKINGEIANTRASYAELSETFKGKIVQPSYDALGVDSNDINADIAFEDLIDKYEEVYGEVLLDSCDFSTPYDSTYLCSKRLKNDLMPIILDYRNEKLAERIVQSDLNKIVVVYGKAHMKGVQELLDEHYDK